MNYIYTQVNRLEQPHAYMYTPFQGVSMLQTFLTSRQEKLKQLLACRYQSVIDDSLDYENSCISSLMNSLQPESIDSFQELHDLLQHDEFKKNDGAGMTSMADRLLELSVTDKVNSIALLRTLIAAQLLSVHRDETKLWLDRLVQRFEVTKKLYQNYQAGFRKGEGATDVVKPYWLLSLALSLYYADNKELKYLSTLLKVNDLLCSLPEQLHADSISSGIMVLILISEMQSIKLLAEKKGISCN